MSAKKCKKAQKSAEECERKRDGSKDVGRLEGLKAGILGILPVPIVLQKPDSIGVSGWVAAKDVSSKGLREALAGE
jgi:hypothetical protein